jgi:uroporphyrinogen-III synthase
VSSKADQILEGVRVLVARPQDQGATLTAQLQNKGAEAIQLPAIEIKSTPLSPSLKNCFLNLDQYHHVIAVSTHAARFGLQWVDQYWPQLPVSIKWYAVGEKTASVLNDADIDVITAFQGNNSEALLDLPELEQLNNENVLILRGLDGRELLKQTLEQRGAKVDYAELYQRGLPNYSDCELDKALIKFSPNILITLSGETLHNLVKLSQNRDIVITDKTVLVPSERVAEQAKLLGFGEILIPDALDEHSLVECIALNLRP